MGAAGCPIAVAVGNWVDHAVLQHRPLDISGRAREADEEPAKAPGVDDPHRPPADAPPPPPPQGPADRAPPHGDGKRKKGAKDPGEGRSRSSSRAPSDRDPAEPGDSPGAKRSKQGTLDDLRKKLR